MPRIRNHAVILASVVSAFAGVERALAQCGFEIHAPSYWHWSDSPPLDRLHLACNDDLLAMSMIGHSDDDWGTFVMNNGVVVFQHDDLEIVDDQFIVDPTMSPFNEFGSMLAVQGNDRVYVSAPREPLGGNGNGRVHVFGLVDGSWEQQATIQMTGDDSALRFGRRLAVTDDQVMVGATLAEVDGVTHLSPILVFDRHDLTLVQVLTHPDGASPVVFGDSLDVDGDRMIIGSTGPATAEFSGQILVYERLEGLWIRVQTIDAPDMDRFELGNPATALHGTVIAAATSPTPNDSFMTLYERGQDGVWTESAVFSTPSLDGLGAGGSVTHGIDVQDNHVALTRAFDAVGGSLHVAERVNGVWELRPGVRPSHYWFEDPALPAGSVRPSMHGFGFDVAIDGSRAAVFGDLFFSLFHSFTDNPAAPGLFVFDLNDQLGEDMNSNGICDLTDLRTGVLGPDLDHDGRDDALEIATGVESDCNGNGIIDRMEPDCDGNGVPLDCEADCNGNGIPDSSEAQYDGRPVEVNGMLFWRFSDLSTPHAIALHPILVEEQGEVAIRARVRRCLVLDNLDLTFVIYRDPDQDDDITDAELVHAQPFRLDPRTPLSGTMINIPDVHLGEVGDRAYYGILISPLRMSEFPWSGGSELQKDGLPNLWVAVWDAGPNDEVSFADLTTVDGQFLNQSLSLDLDLYVAPTPSCCASADFNEDGHADAEDLTALLSQWGPCGETCPADLTGDQVVDIEDLLRLLAVWGTCDGE